MIRTMKIAKFILAMLVTICISVIHVHFSLYTVSNGSNPVTIAMLLSKEDEIVPFLTGYSVQFLVTLFTACFILRFRNIAIWFLVYIIGAFAAYRISIYSPLSYLPIFHDSEITKCYEAFYDYYEAFELGVYYIALQLFVFFLYILFICILKIPFIKSALCKLSAFIHCAYNTFMHSIIYKKMHRNKYTLGTIVLLIILFYMIIMIL